MPAGEPGAITLFEAPAKEHTTFAKHLTNEKRIVEHVPGKGAIARWVNESGKPNHYFDAYYNACVGGSILGFSVVEQERKETPSRPRAKRPKLTTPDGRPFFIKAR